MSTLSTNIYGSSTNKGFGGLISGLDTDDLVNQMLTGAKSKINKQYQAKQKLLYKQQAYREVSSKLVKFSDKYLSYASGSSTNILSPKFFQAYTYKSSSDNVNISGDSDNIKNFEINSITSVASYATMTSTNQVSNKAFSSDVIPGYISSLSGDTFSIKYNDTTYNLTVESGFAGTDLGAVVTQLNEQLSTITGNSNNELLKYSLVDGRIDLNDKSAYLTAASSDFLNVLNMKVGSGYGASSTAEITNTDNLVRTAKQVLLDGTISFELNGVKKSINLSEMRQDNGDGTYTDLYTYDAEGLSKFLQDKLTSAYGADKVTVEPVDGKLTFTASGTTNVFGVSSISTELSNFTGIKSGDYNRLNKTAAMGSGDLGLAVALTETTLENGNQGYAIKINSKLFEFEKTATLNDLLKKINDDTDAKVNVTYSSITDTFSIKADETGSHIGISIEEVGGGNLAAVLFGSSGRVATAGQDTVMSYTQNGVSTSITRSTANFTIDGINLELSKNAAGLTASETPITFNVTNNSDEVIEKVKQFLNDYNEIIDLLNTKTKEKPDRDYQPLTPEQQDEMEEAEIADWVVQAKKGILYSDNNMNSILREIRSAMTGITTVSNLSLSSIGIASASMDTSGKLILDEDKFKGALLENPDEFANLFAGTTTQEGGKSGIAVQVLSVLRKNIGAFGTSGILIDEAGLDGN